MELKRIGIEQKQAIKKLFVSVFTIEPWNYKTDRRNLWEAYREKVLY